MTDAQKVHLKKTRQLKIQLWQDRHEEKQSGIQPLKDGSKRKTICERQIDSLKVEYGDRCVHIKPRRWVNRTVDPLLNDIERQESR